MLTPAKQKQELFGVPVRGTSRDIPELVERYSIQDIIIAIPSAPGRDIRRVVGVCQTTPARLQIVPSIYELLDGRVGINQIREVRVEDLLGREPVNVDLEAMAGYLEGQNVLVTGAGGSIGTELCRQVAQFGPRRLVLLGRGENSLYLIHRELAESYPNVELVQAVVDVRDLAEVRQVFMAYRPHVVFHAAAHKHVPLMEENPGAALKNNVVGTWNAGQAAREAGVESSSLFPLTRP